MPVTTRPAVTARTLWGGLGGVAGVVLIAALAGCSGDAQTPYETPVSSETATFSIPPLTPCPSEKPQSTGLPEATSTMDAESGEGSSSGSAADGAGPSANCSTGVPATADSGENVDNEGNK